MHEQESMNTTSPRDMAEYAAQYRELPFEPIQIKYRRELVLREVKRHQPLRLLEIGCGDAPLFTDLEGDIEVTTIEPSVEFFNRARQLAENRPRVTVVQSFVEDFFPDGPEFDMVVLSSLLHEVRNPELLLANVYRLCGPDTVLHVNVPNARSLHRLLALAMGLISQPGEQSDMQRRMQQRTTMYDADSLGVELEAAGFREIEHGSILVKPFTHAQMQQLVDAGFLTPVMLDGFNNLVQWLPDLGSEIWVNARKAF